MGILGDDREHNKVFFLLKEYLIRYSFITLRIRIFLRIRLELIRIPYQPQGFSSVIHMYQEEVSYSLGFQLHSGKTSPSPLLDIVVSLAKYGLQPVRVGVLRIYEIMCGKVTNPVPDMSQLLCKCYLKVLIWNISCKANRFSSLGPFIFFMHFFVVLLGLLMTFMVVRMKTPLRNTLMKVF